MRITSVVLCLLAAMLANCAGCGKAAPSSPASSAGFLHRGGRPVRHLIRWGGLTKTPASPAGAHGRNAASHRPRARDERGIPNSRAQGTVDPGAGALLLPTGRRPGSRPPRDGEARYSDRMSHPRFARARPGSGRTSHPLSGGSVSLTGRGFPVIEVAPPGSGLRTPLLDDEGRPGASVRSALYRLRSAAGRQGPFLSVANIARAPPPPGSATHTTGTRRRGQALLAPDTHFRPTFKAPRHEIAALPRGRNEHDPSLDLADSRARLQSQLIMARLGCRWDTDCVAQRVAGRYARAGAGGFTRRPPLRHQRGDQPRDIARIAHSTTRAPAADRRLPTGTGST